MDAKLKTGQWTDGEEKISELFVLAQLDIWTSIATALALPSQAVPGMNRSKLAEYVKEEQDDYAEFAQGAVKNRLRQDREMQQGGMGAVATVCAAIERAIVDRIEELKTTGSSDEELVQFQECKQMCGSVLQLYQDAVSIKIFFDDVRHT